jgi:3-hydroxybutyryl-CoA dehydrogenase
MSTPGAGSTPEAKERAPILVVGCGAMGSGIAQVAAMAGHEVFLFDAFENAAAKARDRIAHFLEREVEKGRSTPEAREAALQNLRITPSLEDVQNVAFVFEAIRENLEDKQQLFQKLDALAPPETLLLSNTSMISISDIATKTQHPQRVAGCHFFNPVPRMALVEIIGGEKTARQTLESAASLVTGWGKVPIPAPDTPGFIVNRALMMLLNEAAFLVQEGSAPKDVDAAMKLGCNFPMGPLELMDLIGVDVTYDCCAALWRQFERREKYAPCALLKSMVESGKLGRKSGAGFYDYP